MQTAFMFSYKENELEGTIADGIATAIAVVPVPWKVDARMMERHGRHTQMKRLKASWIM